MELQLHKPLVFFDLETTGTDPCEDRIVQMHFIKQHPDGREEVLSEIINPGIPIPPGASRIHGIYDQDVQNKPHFRDRAPELLTWLAGCDLAGYNSDKFDIPLLAEEFNRAGHIYPAEDTRTVDILLIEREMNSHRLGDTYKRYTGIALDNAHEAGADTRATQTILTRQLQTHRTLACSVEELSAMFSGNRVDWAGKLTRIEGQICYNFGKHKGRPVTDHRDYADWMLKENFTQDTKKHLREALQNKI